MLDRAERFRSKTFMTTVGQWGEELVGEWLQAQKARVLHYRWRSRQTEIDIIAQKQDGTVLFIEVKTRSTNSWDANGLLAIDVSKQAKIALGARIFLGLHPTLAEQPCRFDVALVQRSSRSLTALHSTQLESGEYLQLTRYVVNAFVWDG